MAVKKHTITLRESGQFSSLFLDYLENKEALRPFYSYRPELNSFQKAITELKAHAFDRSLLSDVIMDQYAEVSGKREFQKVRSNIELLRNENTFTVCTAHQPNILTGPLYCIYKIISAITLAARLKKEYPACDFVPVYWIGSEDHDLEEIGTVNMFGKKLNWTPGLNGAVGRMATASMNTLLEEVKQILGTSPNALLLYELFAEAYTNQPTIAAATRSLIHALFAEYGLVIIDGDDTRIKEQFVPIIKDDIANNTNYRIVSGSVSRMKAAGYEAQVNPREINVFHLTANDRVRIDKADSETMNYKTEEYSTNVVLRPLYQQMVLPNIAYVGGPGEIAYWLEYKAMFDHHKIFFPVLMPRNFALLTDEKTSQLMEKLGLEPKDIFRETETLVKEYVVKHTENDISLGEQEESVRRMYAQLAEKAAAIDATLKASVEGELQKTLAAIRNIESKMMRSEKQKQETNVNQIRKIREKFLPEGMLQERHDNFAPFFLKKGRELISILQEAFDPFDFNLNIIEL